MFEKLGKYKVVLGALVVAILAGGVFFTVNQLQKQQEDRSHASGEQVAVLLNPLTSTVAIGDKLIVQVNLNTAQNNVTAADITFTYDPAVLSITSTSASGTLGFSPASNLTTITNDSNTPGTIHFVGVNPSSASISGSMVNIGTISLYAKANGNSTIGFSNIQITAAGISGALTVDTNNTHNGTYTVGTTSTTTTPIACPQDVKVCPSFMNETTSLVARTGPTCDFPACPIISGAPTIQPNNTWTTYANSDFDYSISFPTTYQIAKSDTPPTPTGTEKMCVQKIGGSVGCYVYINAFANPNNSSLQDWMNQNMPGTYNNAHQTKLGDNNAFFVQRSSSNTNAYILSSGKFIYDLELYEDFDTAAIVSTFKSTSTNTTPAPSATPTPFILNAIQRIFDFNDDGKIDELDLNILYSGFAKRNGD